MNISCHGKISAAAAGFQDLCVGELSKGGDEMRAKEIKQKLDMTDY